MAGVVSTLAGGSLLILALGLINAYISLVLAHAEHYFLLLGFGVMLGATAWFFGAAGRKARAASAGGAEHIEGFIGEVYNVVDPDRAGVDWDPGEESLRRIMMTIVVLTGSGAAMFLSWFFLAGPWETLGIAFTALAAVEWLAYYWIQPLQDIIDRFVGAKA